MTRWKFRTIFFWSLAVNSVTMTSRHDPDVTHAAAWFVASTLFLYLPLAGLVFGINRLLCRIRETQS